MRSKIVALAALVLAGGYGAAMAQTNAPSINAAPNTNITTTTTTPSGPGAPVTAPSHPSAQNPMINPNAAGTQTGRELSGSTVRNGEHSGSQQLNANTHPLKALKANRHLRKHSRGKRTGFPPPR
jgi:hypothetical protein